MRTRPLALAGALAACLAACQSAPPPTRETSRWWHHVSTLASDRFQGRLTGSQGYEEAARYVADNFRELGLEPAGADGYLQPVPYEVQTVLADRSSLRLVDGAGRARPLALGDELALDPGVEQPGELTAPMEFIGYGLHLPTLGYDDLAGLDLKGKIAVYLVGAPAGVSDLLQAHSRLEELPRRLTAMGAVGVLALLTPAQAEAPWQRTERALAQPGMYLSEPALRSYRTPMLAGVVNPVAAPLLFAGAPRTFQELAALADARKPLPRFPLALTVSAAIATDHARIAADNVVAELPGSDPELADQAVVLSAHLDHLGTGRPDHGDGTFPGAMDNASGVASLLEVARLLRAGDQRPRRSILFVALGGEEKGLLGSRYFTAHPSRHVGALVADINMDMFLPLFPLRDMVAYGADESSLGSDVRQTAERAHLVIAPDPQPDRLILERSDQYSFIRRGIPAVMLDFAAAPGDGKEAALQAQWFELRYHTQADDAGQQVDLAAADAYDRYLAGLALRVSGEDDAPRWRDGSFFRRFAAKPLK